MGNVETLVTERRSGLDRRASERVFHQAAKNLVEAMKMSVMAEGVERVASRDLRYAHESLDAASLAGCLRGAPPSIAGRGSPVVQE